MTVSRILEKKGHRVLTIGEGASLRDVVRELAQHHVGALVVTDAKEEPAGIISERDVIRELAGGAAALEKPVSDCMTRLMCKCGLDDTEGEVMELMTKAAVRHLPVQHGNKLVGVISARDIMNLRIEKLNELMSEIMSQAAVKP